LAHVHFGSPVLQPGNVRPSIHIINRLCRYTKRRYPTASMFLSHSKQSKLFILWKYARAQSWVLI